ncbi:MAG: T9SS type A sorting domain-containing protein, partial [Bacteroidales bacterium]|nr:T9SS type A sorting domain-containing protein [Bacteroidales bacterium]
MFSDPSGTPYFSDFPTANMGTDDGNIYVYLNKDNSSIRMLGYEGDLLQTGHIYKLEYLPNGQEMIFFPMNYQDQDSTFDYYDLTIDANDVGAGTFGDSARQKLTEYTTRTVDAYGQVSIPNATFDCLRVNKQIISIDSSWIHNQILGWQFYQVIQDTTYSYEWYSDDSQTKYAVASVDYNPATNQPVDSTDFAFLKFNPIKITIQQGKGFGIYPNPATDNFYVYGLVPGSEIQLLDITGNIILKQQISSAKERINLSSIKTGIYFVKAISGKKVYLKKLIVQ